MTSTVPDVVVEPTPAELHQGIQQALGHLGVTYDELARQAADDDFQSPRAQMIWVAISGLRQYA